MSNLTFKSENENHYGGKKNYLEVNYAHKKNATPYDFKLIGHIFDLANIKGGGRVLDLACGVGTFKSVFEAFDMEYFGVDIDSDDLTKNIRVCDIAFEEFPFENNFFNVVFFKMGIEHLTIKEIGHCLREANRVLAKNGTLIVITPDWDWTYQSFYEEYTHQTPFMASSLRSALEMSGYKCNFCQSYIQLPIAWRFPVLRHFFNFLSIFYPLTKKTHKLIKFSKERILLAFAIKN